MRWKRVIPWSVFALAGSIAGLLALDAAFPPRLDRYLDRSLLVVDRDDRPLRAFTSRDGMWRMSARPEGVDPRYLTFLKTYEDQRFDDHFGVDPLAAIRAVGQWAASGRPVSGASTLTMQAVRLLEPRPRTLVSKAVEALRAIQLEWHFDKSEILSIYLTLAPFGGNIEGVTAASWLYFGKSPRSLSAAEAALLVALPQSPSRTRPDRFPAAAMAARAKVLDRLAAKGVLEAEDERLAEQEPIPSERHDAPMMAAHLSRDLARHAGSTDRIRTTVDGNLQRTMEDLARRHASGLDDDETVALLVMENDTREIRAYVGSADIMDDARQGHVDMVQAVRSPGSTLKPFVYGLAFDALNLHPETLVDDRPTRFGDYAPTNFDNRYRGRITIREALQLSLNVPAVAVLDAVGPAVFVRSIEDAGVHPVLDSRTERPGLPAVLGGIGFRLWDLVALYGGLANRGRVVMPAVIPDGPKGDPVFLLSEKASWYVTRILRGAPPPLPRVGARFVSGGREVAIKTGTSYGFRDVWAIGYDSRFTVGVWVGRPAGGFGTGRTGRSTAAPIVAEVFDNLPLPRDRDILPPPPDILDARTWELPPPMRTVTGRAESVQTVVRGSDQPTILFPLDGAVVEMSGRNDLGDSIQLKAEGGRKPLRWLVQGKPLDTSPVRRSVSWAPAGEGGFVITVVDAEGRSSRARIWVRQRAGRDG